MTKTFFVECANVECELLNVSIEVPASSFLDGVEYPTSLVFCGLCSSSIDFEQD